MPTLSRPSSAPTRLAGLSLFLALSLAPWSAVAADVSIQVDDHALAEAMRVRAEFGLSSDAATTRTLLINGSDVGSNLASIPMTSSEAATVNIDARTKYAHDLSASVASYARSLPSFAGIWLDQRDNSRPTILLTVIDGAETNRLRELDPDPGRGLRIVQVANSYGELVKAIDGAGEALREVAPKATLVGAAVDEATNAARLYVLPGEGPDVRAGLYKLEALLGVHVMIDEEPMGHDAACANRDSCANPMKAGIRIHRGSTTSTTYCTQGFIVDDGTDEQILTSGHCGFGSNSNNWYHPAYGTSAFGGEISPDTPDGTLYGPNGRDVMRVRFPDAQSTVSIYGQSEAIDMQQDRVPLQGEAIWFSGASTTTNPVRAGTVESAWWHWKSEGCACEVYGGRGSWAPVPGDSGGPAYSRISVTSPYPHLVVDPIGVISHQNGGFARVFDATIAWDLTMYGQ